MPLLYRYGGSSRSFLVLHFKLHTSTSLLLPLGKRPSSGGRVLRGLFVEREREREEGEMLSSRERKKQAAALQEKLKILRSITHSHALSNASIIMDASAYIKELKQKVVRLNQEIACAQDALQRHKSSSYPTVTVETLGAGGRQHGGFLINVVSDKTCPGLLVSVLESFDELGLSVLQATASCADDSFRLEAVGGENAAEKVDEHVVKQAVLQAIRNCCSESSSSDHDDEE